MFSFSLYVGMITACLFNFLAFLQIDWAHCNPNLAAAQGEPEECLTLQVQYDMLYWLQASIRGLD